MYWLFTGKHWQILFTVLLLAEPCLSSAGQETLNYQGLNRTYYVHVPENLKQGASLVVVLHGYTSSAETIMSYSGMNEVADVNNFIAVYPQGTIDSLGNTFFNVGYAFHADSAVDDVGFIEALVVKMQTAYELDPKNTFATGMSNGGDMSYLLACTKSAVFSAVAPVAGVMMKTTLDTCEPKRNIPIFEIHGTKDEISRFAGDLNNDDGWGAYYDLPSTIAFWVKRHGLDRKTIDAVPDKDTSDGSHILFERYFSSSHVNEVWFYKVEGGQHTWPGWSADIKWWKNPLFWYYLRNGNNDINASHQIWSFFEQYRNNISTLETKP
jgi:polyhydroxybutyrate depolymerase